jgi:hypothetical protein
MKSKISIVISSNGLTDIFVKVLNDILYLNKNFIEKLGIKVECVDVELSDYNNPISLEEAGL